MRHRVAGRKLGRTSEHRLALLRNLSTALFDKEKIRTTLSKAKELRPFAERLVTLSKKETLHARRQVLRHIRDQGVVSKLFDTISARYAERPGGYTRIVKLGPRRGDQAEMAIIELVGSVAEEAEISKPTKKRKTKKPAQKAADSAAAEPAAKKRTSKKKKKTASKAEGAGGKDAKGPARAAKKKPARKGVSRKSAPKGK